jgi:hypothetical protein
LTELESNAPAADTWESILDGWRRRYPGQRDSVLFCIHKLQQNPELTLRDFRDEARLHGIPVAGRSLHSARVLLGLAKAPVAREAEPETEPDANDVGAEPAPVRRRGPARATSTSSIEDQVVAAVRSIQSAASADVERLRAGMRQAIAILQRALGDD